MHELGLIKDMISVVEEKIRGREYSVEKVNVRLGVDSEFSNDSLVFWFDKMVKGSRLRGARLDIKPVPGRGLIVDEIEIKEEA